MSTGVVKKQQKSEMTEHGDNNMKISQEGLSLIKKFEGCPIENGQAVSYKCAAGVWTIGYGSTKYKGKPVEGDMFITVKEAEDLLLHEMNEYEGYVNDLVKVTLHQHQFDSLVAWVFNLGPSNLQSSTLLKVLNSGAYEDVPAQIKRWNKANGKVLEGLNRRRLAEALLFEGNDWEHI